MVTGACGANGHLDIGGARIAVMRMGDGRPVVALHGSAATGVQWAPLGARISSRFRLLAPDFHGCGASPPWPGRHPLRLEDEAAIVAALAGRAGEPIHLVGHCYGGAVALKAAVSAPERIASLTLIEPTAFHLLRQSGPAERRLFAEVNRLSDRVAQALAGGDAQAAARHFIDYWSEPGSAAALSGKRKSALAARMPRLALELWASMIEHWTLAQLACQLAVPVLILEGDRSPTPARWICRMLEAALPSAWLVTLPDAGHMAPLSDPDPMNLMIASFLADCSCGAPRRLCASA